MNKERIIIWGTGGVAWQTFHDCQTINQYEILAFVDNDKEKWGTQYRGIEIHSPEFVFQNKSEYSKIVILTNSFEEIRLYCLENNLDLASYVDTFEDINDYLEEVYDAMNQSVDRGLNAEGFLPGELEIKRKAKELLANENTSDITKIKQTNNNFKYSSVVKHSTSLKFFSI